MTKRLSDFPSNCAQTSKKSRTEDFEELWDDDFDDDACLQLATQAEIQDTNESILPSYNAFKVPAFCSTQLPGGLENELEELKRKIKEKDGEVSILRSQIAEKSVLLDKQHAKLHAEWQSKYSLSVKEVQSVKTELQFKNLEVVQLKQKLVDFRRHSVGAAPPEATSIQITPILSNYFPLENWTFPGDFNAELNSKPHNIKLEGIFKEISLLKSCGEDDFLEPAILSATEKLVSVTMELLDDLKTFLAAILKDSSCESIQQMDVYYLENVSRSSNEEFGVQAAHCLELLSYILPHSQFTNDLIVKKPDFLNEILEIVSKIGQLRKAGSCNFFLVAVIQLLGFVSSWEQVALIAKQIIFARPTGQVIEQLAFLLKQHSNEPKFIEFFFGRPSGKCRKNQKKGLVYFAENSCKFYVFAILFELNLLSLNCKEFNVLTCFNLLSFFYNSFRRSFEVHHSDFKCECLSQLNKTVIEVLNKVLEKYDSKSPFFAHFFQSKMPQKILSLSAFNSYQYTEKSVKNYGLFKQIELQLTNLGLEAENLNLTDDLSEFSCNLFDETDFI